MKNVKSLIKKASTHSAQIALLNGELVRCETVSRAAQHEDHHIETLKKQRGEEVANFDAEKASEKALAEGEAARMAIPVINARIASESEQFKAVSHDIVDAVTVEILAQHDTAQERYFAAIETMRLAAEEMVASEKTWRHVLRPAPAAQFPGHGAKVLDDIRSNGLRVRWDHSQLRDSNVSAQYLPGFENTYFIPWWADERNTAFAETQFANNVREFQSIGYDCPPYRQPVIEIKEKTVVVQMVRGTAEQSDIKINAATGAKVTVSRKTFGPGDTIVLSESEAAQFVIGGMANYFDGCTKQSAFRFLRPSKELPAAVTQTEQQSDGAEEVQVTIQYDGYAAGEAPGAVFISSPGLANVSNR